SVAACAALPDPTTILRLQDVALQPDMIALAAPEIAGLAPSITGLFAAAALAAALITAGGPLAATVEALCALVRRGEAGSDAATPASVVLAVAVIGIAALAAAARPAGMLMLATWAFTLAGAGLLPALAAGLWWRRASGLGASLALIS